MQRREFITLLGGAAAAWPVIARAQSAKNVRRVGILWPGASPPASPRLELFREGLREAGFIEGENLVIELRYSKTGLLTQSGHVRFCLFDLFPNCSVATS